MTKWREYHRVTSNSMWMAELKISQFLFIPKRLSYLIHFLWDLLSANIHPIDHTSLQEFCFPICSTDWLFQLLPISGYSWLLSLNIHDFPLYLCLINGIYFLSFFYWLVNTANQMSLQLMLPRFTWYSCDYNEYLIIILIFNFQIQN